MIHPFPENLQKAYYKEEGVKPWLSSPNNSAKSKAQPPLLLLFHSTGDVRALRIPSIPLLTLAALQRGFGGAVDFRQ
jgi:hypothetical protein